MTITYGNNAGDPVLRVFGDFLKKQARREDIACRYVDEEFVMVFPGIDEANLLSRCEDI